MAMFLRRSLHTALFLCALSGTAALLRHADEVPVWSWSRPRFVQACADVDRHDTVFIGSSRVHSGVVPAVFDRRMAELGFRTESLNFAVSGLRGHDCDECIEWLLDRRPARIRTMVIELNTFDQRLRGANWLADQDVEMHAPRQFWRRVAGIRIAKEPWSDKLKQLRFVTMHTLANAFRVGQGARLLDALLARARGLPVPGGAPVADRGFQAMEATAAADIREEARRLAEEPDRPRDLLSYKWGAEQVAAETGGFPMAAFDAVDARVRAAGIEPIYVVMPSHYTGFFGRDAIAEIAKRATVLDLDRPQQFPELFERALWFDPGHFNARGAEVFSADLAARIAAIPSWRSRAHAAPPPEPPAASSTPTPPGIATRLAWLDGGSSVLDCEATGLPATGVVVVAIDFVTVASSLPGGATASLPVPPAFAQPIERVGGAEARGRCDLAALLAGSPAATQLHAQVAVVRDGNVTAIGPVVTVAVRR